MCETEPQMSSEFNFAGIVLAGGRSTRMGRDKASLQIGGQTMLGRVISTLRSMPMCRMVIVVAAEDQQLPELPGSVVVARDRSPNCGPLEGFATGLVELRKQAKAPTPIERCFLTSCDAPFLACEFVDAMMFKCRDAIDAAVPMHNGYPQPLAAAYSVSVLPIVEELLRGGIRSLTSIFPRVRTEHVDSEFLRQADPELLSLRNINTAEDFEWAERTALRVKSEAPF